MRLLSKLWRGFIGLFYPRTCPVCGDILLDTPSERCLCMSCRADLQRPLSPKSAHILLEDRLEGNLDFEHAVCAYYFQKDSVVQKLVHQLKYHGREDIGEMLGRDLGRVLLESGKFADVDCIVPVPLHKKKLRKRGYNQCEAIARGISEITGWEIERDALVRKIYNESQTTMNSEQRWENSAGIFSLDLPDKIAGKNVLVVDDIITTGATMASCCAELSKAPEVRIYVASVACTC